MNKYRVEFILEEKHHCDVEAKNKKDAEKKGWDIANEGELIDTGNNSRIDLVGVEKL